MARFSHENPPTVDDYVRVFAVTPRTEKETEMLQFLFDCWLAGRSPTSEEFSTHMGWKGNYVHIPIGTFAKKLNEELPFDPPRIKSNDVASASLCDFFGPLGESVWPLRPQVPAALERSGIVSRV